MALQLPGLEDLGFEQLVAEAKRRIPQHTPEWTNFEGESDPGITIVQLFAFLTESLLYRANQVPERNRLKFLNLLGIHLQPAAAARGLVAIRNERGPLRPLTLESGVIVAAGQVGFITEDPVTVLPLEAQAFHKRVIAETDPRHADFETRYEAVRVAASLAAGAPVPDSPLGRKLRFYETVPLPAPSPGDPQPVVDLNDATSLDRAIHLALLAPKNVDPAEIRAQIAGQTLSLGVVPALLDEIGPLGPEGRRLPRATVPRLVYEIPDMSGAGGAAYRRLEVEHEPDVLDDVGIVRLRLPGAAELRTFEFGEPLEEGTGDYPPKLDDEKLAERLVTWLRLRLDAPEPGPAATNGAAAIGGSRTARLAWVGINAVRVVQAVPVVGEPLGRGLGEPDQTVRLAQRPVLPASIVLETETSGGTVQRWRPIDDLLAARPQDRVYVLDPEAGEIRFGDGLRGAVPAADARIRASYRYGGGRQGNVAIKAINASPDPRLQGGFKLENPVPTWGGDEGEGQAEGEKRIPLQVRHRDRLVTRQDFADITWRTPGVDVGRVDVVPLFHPGTAALEAPGVVTIMVVPRHDAARPLWPTPDRLFLRTVCAHLAPRRLITTELHVRGPRYVPAFVTVGVRTRSGHFIDKVVQDVRTRLRQYLSSLPPGGPEETGWPLGKALVRKELEAVVARVTGVAFVEGLKLGVSGTTEAEEFPLTGLELPWLAAIDVREGQPDLLAALLGTTTPAPPAVEILPVPVFKATC